MAAKFLEVYEEFAKVLITSVKPESVIGSVELPQASDSGTYEFAQLQVCSTSIHATIFIHTSER